MIQILILGIIYIITQNIIVCINLILFNKFDIFVKLKLFYCVIYCILK